MFLLWIEFFFYILPFKLDLVTEFPFPFYFFSENKLYIEHPARIIYIFNIVTILVWHQLWVKSRPVKFISLNVMHMLLL